MKYRREVDGLRAVAVLPVILFHGGFGHFSGGFVGVDVFFVISGYLITTIILAEVDKGSFSLARFYERRARRILPALFTVMAVCLPLAWLALTPTDMRAFARSVLAVIAFSSNILFWRESGYFGAAAELKPLLHTWSLAVEEQYYLLFPLLLILARNVRREWLFGALAVLAACSLAVAHHAALTRPSAAFFLLPTRGWELLLGSLVAMYCAGPRTPPKAAGFLALFGLALILVAIFAFDHRTPFPGLYALVPTMGAALILLYAGPGNAAGMLLGRREFVAVGLVSYSAYLWHQPLFVFARHLSLGEPGPMVFGALTVLTFGMAAISWRWVEQPFRDRERIPQRRMVLLLSGGAALFGLFGILGSATSLHRELKIDAATERVLATAVPSPKRAACHHRRVATKRPACEYHVSPATWAAFGDSHVVELAYALADELRPFKQGVRHYSHTACPPSYKTPGAVTPCSLWTDENVELIASDPKIRHVVVAYRLNGHLFGDHERIYPALPQSVSAEVRRQRWNALVRMMQRFADAGQSVTLVLQAPELPKPVEHLALLHGLGEQDEIAGVSREWWERRNSFVQQHLIDLPGNVTVVDPAQRFCDARTCYAARDGVSLYFDDDHMSVAGAQLVAMEITKAAHLTAGQADGASPPAR